MLTDFSAGPNVHTADFAFSASHTKGEQARWYAAQCLSNREAGASDHLKNQNFEVFLPRRQKTRRHARKIETVLAPFFPGYLFVRLDLKRDRWRSVNGTYGIARLVMQGEFPAPVPVGVVETLRGACDQRDVLRWQSDLKLGQSVRVLVGPFAGLVGRLERLDDADRIRVLLEFMGGQVPVRVSHDDVVPADSCL